MYLYIAQLIRRCPHDDPAISVIRSPVGWPATAGGELKGGGGGGGSFFAVAVAVPREQHHNRSTYAQQWLPRACQLESVQ
jgi:hypothetical protein